MLDRRAGRVVRAGLPLALEPHTFDVLVHLMERPGELVSHGELLDIVWGDVVVTPHSLTQAISQLRLALDDRAQAPTFIETVHRKGYRWIAPVHAEPADPAWPGLSTSVGPWRVPARAESLVGRDDLIERVVRELQHARLVTLVGSGGVGKTQLALEAARRVEQTFQGGAMFVDLTAEVDAPGVEQAVLRTLRIVSSEGVSALDALARALRDRHLLLIIDNCEHVAEACGAIASRLIGSAPRVHLLATSQQPLHVSGEVLIRVPPLAVPSPGWSSFGARDCGDWPASVALFVQRARTANPDFDLTSTNGVAVADICRRLDGIPLALELAAARMNVLTAAQIADRLDQRFQLLSSLRQADLARHQTLAATVSWSVGLLSDRVQGLLNQLAVFSGGWTLEAARAVVTDGQDATLIDDLATLADRSLVIVDVDRHHARYRLLETIRLYAHQRFVCSAQAGVLRDRHLRHYCAFAQHVDREMLGPESLGCLRTLREEYANVRAALGWAMATPGNAEEGLRLACGLRWAWRIEGDYIESRERLTEAIARAQDSPPSLVGRARIALGLILHHRAEFSDAGSAIEQGLSQLPAEEVWERAFGTVLLAFNETMSGSPERAEALAQSANGLVRPLEDDRLSGFALIRDGVASGLAGDHQLAATRLTEACRLLCRAHDRFLLTYGGTNLGLQRYLAGKQAGSREAFFDSLTEACALGNLRAIAGNVEGFSYLAADAGEYRWSARLLSAAARLRETTAAPLLPQWRDAHDRVTATVEDRLGPARFARELRAGAEAPLADVIGTLRREA